MLFCSALEGTCTGSDIFTKLDTKIKEMELSWDNCVGVCTDGAGAMVGKNKGLKAKVLEVAPHVKFTHCIIRRESLLAKTLDSELNNVLKCAIKIGNHIKSRPVNSRLLATRLMNLREEVHSLLKDSKLEFAHCLTNPAWLSKLAYLACIFERLNMPLICHYKGQTQISWQRMTKLMRLWKKLERWAERVWTRKCGDVSWAWGASRGEWTESQQPERTHHWSSPQPFGTIQEVFPKETQPEVYDWIRQPFSKSKTHLPTNLEDALLELSSDRTLNLYFLIPHSLNFGSQLQTNTQNYPVPAMYCFHSDLHICASSLFLLLHT